MRLPHGRPGHLPNPSGPASAYGFHVASATARQGAPGWSRPPSSPRREASLFDFGRYPNGLAPFFFARSGLRRPASAKDPITPPDYPGVTNRFAAAS